jgi:hypothetical protein
VPLTEHIALVSLTRDIQTRHLLQVAAAIQKQVTRDFIPVWEAPATVNAFADLVSVPNDYHHVVIFNEPSDLVDRLEFAIGEERAARLVEEFRGHRLEGIHLNEFTRQPFALVALSDSWTVVTSHEVLELIADPYGNRLRAAAHPLNAEQRVNYLVEVCDPCQAIWYHVNGVPVSDFYTPRFFEPVRIGGLRYSFTGEVTRPLEILDGGYVSWIDPADSGLYQLGAGQAAPTLIASAAELRRTVGPLRTIVDTNPQTPRISNWATLRAADSAAAPRTANLAIREASEGAARRTAQAVASLASEQL